MIVEAARLSLVSAGAATLAVVVVGTAAGWLLARGRFAGRDVLDALLQLPLVLPPTVTGYALLVLLGRRGLLGEPLARIAGVTIPFGLAACAIAAGVMALPLMVRAARSAFEAVDRRHELAAASLGCTPLEVFRAVTLPLARRGLVGGAVLSFARALGEFGATLMLAGNIPGRTQTLPLAIYEAVLSGDDRAAMTMALVLTAISVGVTLVAIRSAR